jgi:hypothetical protein
MEEETNKELDITQLHIGQLIQVKETKEIVKILAINGYASKIIEVKPFRKYHLEQLQLPEDEKRAFWLVESNNNTTRKNEYGFYSTGKVPMVDVREFAGRKMKEDKTITRIDIINSFNDINYIESQLHYAERKQNF